MKEDFELAEHILKNSEMSVFTLNEVLDRLKDKDNKIKDAIENILTTYSKFQKEAKTILEKEHQEIDTTSIGAKMMAKMGIKKEVKCDNSDASIASMLIEGITMGSVDMTKKIHSYQENVDKKTLILAKDFLKFQEEAIEKLKKFL